MKRLAPGLLPALVLLLALTVGCGGGETLTIFHAGSLAMPLDQAGEAFTAQHSDVTVQTEGGGSRTTIRKVTELGKPADVVAVADYLAIEELMFPDHADWYLIFASNEMVIAYDDGAPFADEIENGERTWYDVFINEDVEYGHSDANADPCGYRTLMLWQLAEAYYGEPGLYQELVDGCPKENTRPKSVELIALLQAGALDYAFEYRSVAMQHDQQYLALPDEIDLSDFALVDYYAQAEVEVTGKEPGTSTTLIGAPIAYGVTIPRNAPHPELALSFLQFLLGPEGQAIMADCGQPPIVPAIASDLDRLPVELKQFVLP